MPEPARQHPTAAESALSKRVGESPSALSMSMAEGAAGIMEQTARRCGLPVEAIQDKPDIQVLAWGWAASVQEMGLLMKEKVRQQDIHARERCGGNYDQAIFELTNSKKYQNVESKIARLKKQLGEWEEDLALRVKALADEDSLTD